METLLTILVLVLLSAASGWLKKRTEGQETETRTPPQTPDRTVPPPRRSPPGGHTAEPRPATRSWEEELRRLLEGEPAPPPPPPPRPKAPPAAPAQPQPAPPVLRAPRTSPPAYSTPSARPEILEVPALQMAELRESSTARQQAQRLKERAAGKLRRAETELARNLARTHVTHRAALTEEIAAARTWLQNPQAARQAVIASVILGPPVGS